MRRVAILIAASPTPSFYSQVAVLNLALRKLTWSRWQPSVHMYLGGRWDLDAYAEWRPHLRDVDINWVSDTRFSRDGDWAQSDDALRCAPRDVDVFLAMDADTFPVAPLEAILDRILETEAIGGVIAHYPTVLGFAFDTRTSSFSIRPGPPFPEASLRAAWNRMGQDIIDVPLDFAFSHTLMRPESPAEHRVTPFYLNFGVVFFPKVAFDEVTLKYLEIRPKLMDRLPSPDFSGQAALTLAIASAGVKTLALPMRYNFPNDPVAADLYPRGAGECRNIPLLAHFQVRSSQDLYDCASILGVSRPSVDRSRSGLPTICQSNHWLGLPLHLSRSLLSYSHKQAIPERPIPDLNEIEPCPIQCSPVFFLRKQP